MTPLLVFECPSCQEPVTAKVPAKGRVDPEGQIYCYLGCARCRVDLQVLLAALVPDPQSDPGDSQ